MLSHGVVIAVVVGTDPIFKNAPKPTQHLCHLTEWSVAVFITYLNCLLHVGTGISRTVNI